MEKQLENTKRIAFALGEKLQKSESEADTKIKETSAILANMVFSVMHLCCASEIETVGKEKKKADEVGMEFLRVMVPNNLESITNQTFAGAVKEVKVFCNKPENRSILGDLLWYVNAKREHLNDFSDSCNSHLQTKTAIVSEGRKDYLTKRCNPIIEGLVNSNQCADLVVESVLCEHCKNTIIFVSLMQTQKCPSRASLMHLPQKYPSIVKVLISYSLSTTEDA